MTKKYYIIGGVVLVLLIVLISVLIASSGKKPVSTGDIELTWWKTFETSENIQELITDYQNINKNVTINFVKKDATTYEQDLLNAYASGNAPDILSIHNDWLPMQLDRLVPDSAGDIRDYKSSFVDVAADDFIKDGKIYAVPMNIDLLALYYNKDLLATSGVISPPTTWEELVSDVQKITKVDKPGTFARSALAFGTAANVNRAAGVLYLLMLQNGTKFYNQDFSSTSIEEDVPQPDGSSYNPASAALEFYTQFANPAKKTYTWNARSDNSIDAFTQGKVAMMLSYYYTAPQIKDKSPLLNWDIAPVPQISANSLKVNFAHYWGEAVNKNSKNAAAAWDFLNFITSKDELSKYYSQHKLISSRKDILATQISDPEIGVYAEGALTAKSLYKKNANGLDSIFAQMIDDVSVKGLTPSEAVSNAVQQIEFQLQN